MYNIYICVYCIVYVKWSWGAIGRPLVPWMQAAVGGGTEVRSWCMQGCNGVPFSKSCGSMNDDLPPSVQLLWPRLRKHDSLLYIVKKYIMSQKIYIHTFIHTYIHTYTHTYTYIHTYIHAYIHTYIHTYPQSAIISYKLQDQTTHITLYIWIPYT